ncbi:DNA polymerase [Synechococcus sp. LA31]|uniref:DNA polymerase n=1 Tax=Synechococcus sp. LA31 TaxID=2741953 RepID=UPI001BDD6672|nr:DNA polymerase [Synechococcus sp. LA31]QVV66537.1 hypothetical protein KJJ24_08355 [Synechococcus sp. LA31]
MQLALVEGCEEEVLPAKPKRTRRKKVADTPVDGLSDAHRDYIRGRGYTDEQIKWLVAGGFLRTLTWEQVRDEWHFTRAAATETGGLLICWNPGAEHPHYSLRCDNPPVDEERGRADKYLFQTGAGEHLAVCDPSGLIGPDGEVIGQAEVSTEGFFDAVCCTLVLGIPCVAITAPSHLRRLELPEGLKAYLGDCDQWMAQDLLPGLVRGCVSKGLRLGRLPLVEEYRDAYLGPHAELPTAAKGGMEELVLAHGTEGARTVVEALRQTARPPGDYLAWEIGELKELGIRWPEHSGPITNLISAMADAHPENAPKRDALKALLVQATGVGAKTVNEGIKGRLERRRETDLKERHQQREQARADALARGEQLPPEIDRATPTSLQLQEWLAFSHTIRFNELTRVPEVDGNPITDLGLTYQLVAQQHGIEAGKNQAADALVFVAKTNTYNPVAEYLEGLRANEATPLMELSEVAKLFGLDPRDELSAGLLQRALAGTTKRGLEPGAKFDQCPILRSRDQGLGKTEALRSLAGPGWGDTLGKLDSRESLSGWKVTSKMARCWILELGEVDQLTKGRCSSEVKDWITTRNDIYAEKREINASEHPRRCVPWGTTNESELLNDITGSRRFWIIEVVHRIDWDLIAHERDRIWRTALAWLDAGTETWLNPNSEEGAALLAATEERSFEATFTDPWVSSIAEYLEEVVHAHSKLTAAQRERLTRGDIERVSPAGDFPCQLRLRYISRGHREHGAWALLVTRDDIHDAMGIRPAQRDNGTSGRIGRAMESPAIKSAGWERVRAKKYGHGFYLLLPPEGDGGSKTGSKSPAGSKSGNGTKNPDGEMDLPLVPNLLEEKPTTYEDSSLSGSPETHANPNTPTPESAGTFGTSPKPLRAKGSRDRKSIRNQPPGDSEPAVKAADPTPFVGTPPAGVTYIAAADQLPAVASIPRAIGFDIETFNRRTDLWRHKASLSPSLGGEIRLAQISTGDTEPTLVIDVAVIGQPALDWLAQIVRTPERVVVGHNLLFEATYLIAAGIRPLCRWWDTMLASQLIGDLSSNSLASVAKYYLNREIDKGEQLSNWGSELTASQLAYAALDAVVVRPLAKRLREELQATGQEHAHRLDCQMIGPCADGQVRGLAVDLQMVAVAREHATTERDQKVAALQQMLGLENYRNAVKLRDALAEHTGQPLADAKGATLERYRGFPAVDLLLEIKELDTELKEITWLEQEQALTDGRIRPNYRILGARTGRTTTSALVPSSKQSVPSDTEVFGPKAQKAGQPKPVKLGQLGFNFQGLTGDRKKALSTGNPDTVLIDLDWSSIEVRLQASPRLYNDEGQRKILLEGIDPHAYIASQVCGRQITKADPERSTIGKTANFSLAYGCGVKNLARQLELAQGKPVSYGQAEKVYKAWHRFHPQISQLMARFDDGARITESRSLSGRRMTVRGKTLDNNSRLPLEHLGRTNGINFPIQGSGRDLLADALGDLWPALEAFPGTRVVGLIHDEILLEVPREHVEAVKAVALEAMTSQRLQDAYLGDIPLEADASVGETWGEVH